jgi:hypothetical protein
MSLTKVCDKHPVSPPHISFDHASFPREFGNRVCLKNS